MNSSTLCLPTSGRVSSARAERAVTDRVTPATWRSELVRVSDALGAVHEARILLEEVSGTPFASLVLRLDDPVPLERLARLGALVRSRLGSVPLQHLVGHWPFRNLELLVDARALIPRPETEEVVGRALAELARIRRSLGDQGANGPRLSVVDLGTGSGAISCAIADEDDGVEVIAVDLFADALALAAENVGGLREGARERIELRLGSWYGPLATVPPGSVDCIVANPPYVDEAAWRDLEPEVRDHDPYSALVSGPSGLEDLATIIAGAPRLLRAHGALVCEIGADQSGAVRELAARAGFGDIEIASDLVGRDRVLVARGPDA